MPVKVCIFTSVHKPFDVRVFHRQAVSLAAAGYEVVLLAHADFSLEKKLGVTVKGVARPSNRWRRLTGLLAFYFLCKKETADVYHFHDFELLPIGWCLKKSTGRKVIYDCHENYPETAYERAWLPDWIRPSLSRFIAWLEPALARALDGVVCVVPDQQARLRQAGCNTLLIRNLPRLEVFAAAYDRQPEKENQIVYLGGLSAVRGARMMVDIMVELRATHPQVNLLCIGPFNEAFVEKETKAYVAEKGMGEKIRYIPFVPHEHVADYLVRSRAGLIPWQPSLQTQKMVNPNKVFEYMACGLPLVASDLPSLQYILQQSHAGLEAKADDAAAHAAAIRRLLDDPDLARQLGENGRRFVYATHNWEREGEKLIRFYQGLNVAGDSDVDHGR
jgi:glycosyltransferase involved in cell wall biosynthesis